MEFGVTMFPTDFSIGPAELAIAVEERDLDALFIPDHTHIPAARTSAFRIGDELPADYYRNVDMFVALAAAAAVTKRIRLGTGVCLVIERDPIVTAKEVASLDHISGGRVDFGVGGGWNREELENHGTPWARRFKVLRERVEAMKTIWTQDEATYEGEFVQFDRIWSWPKPLQKPYPPIFVGGDAPKTFERVLRYGDGWIPMLAEKDDMRLEEKYARMRQLADLARQAGRNAIPITTFGTPSDSHVVEQLGDSGVTRCIFGIKSGPADKVLRRLDRVAGLREEFLKQH
ncbi:MAG: LLM class F420-dependent oxidoreductase [Chromatiales bacterium]|nr:LLM class F420-dependent oxidoreductase [Chromatiales bacterium]